MGSGRESYNHDSSYMVNSIPHVIRIRRSNFAAMTFLLNGLEEKLADGIIFDTQEMDLDNSMHI